MVSIVTVDIDQIISSISKNLKALKTSKNLKALKTLSTDTKRLVANNHYMRCKLLNSKYDNFPILKILEPYINRLSCMDFIDLLWIIGDDGYDMNRRIPDSDKQKNVNNAIELLYKLVHIDQTDYHLLINLLNSHLNGEHYITNKENAKFIFSSIINLLNCNSIIISDRFMMHCTRYVTDWMFFDFLLMCVEHNKKFGIKPNNKLLSLLRFDLWSMDYDENTIKRLLEHFDNVNPTDVELLVRRCSRKEICEILVRNIKFDKEKLALYAFSNIMKEVATVDPFDKSLSSNLIYTKLNKKRKNLCTPSQENCRFNLEKKLCELYKEPDFTETDFNTHNFESAFDQEIDKFDKYKHNVIRIEINGTKLGDISYIEDTRRENMFKFYFVEDIEIYVPNNTYMHYESIIRKNRFIRVFSRNFKIDILIWDLNDKSMKVNHYHINKCKNNNNLVSLCKNDDETIKI